MPEKVIHHSDKGLQYLSICYTNRLESANVKAFNKTVNGLYKTEVIDYLKSDWTNLSDVELVTLKWVDWFNKKRLHSTTI